MINQKQMDTKKLFVQNRVLQESLKMMLEFKRILQTMFNDPLLAKNRRLGRLRVHFNRHLKNYELVRNSFDDILLETIERIDDRSLTNCYSIKCPLESCSPEEDCPMRIHSDGKYTRCSNKRKCLNDRYVEQNREGEAEFNDDGDDQEEEEEEVDMNRSGEAASEQAEQPNHTKKIKTSPPKPPAQPSPAKSTSSSVSVAVTSNTKSATLVPMSNDEDNICFSTSNIKKEIEQPEIEIDSFMDEPIDDNFNPDDQHNQDQQQLSEQTNDKSTAEVSSDKPTESTDDIPVAATDESAVPTNVPNESSNPVDTAPETSNLLRQHLTSTSANPTINTQSDEANQNEPITSTLATVPTVPATTPTAPSNDNTSSVVLPKENKYPCRVMNCKEVFSSANEVYAHVKQHSKLFKCSVCNGLFTSKKEVFNHFKASHDSMAKPV